MLLLASGQSYLPCTPVLIQAATLSCLYCSVVRKQGMQVVMKDEMMKGSCQYGHFHMSVRASGQKSADGASDCTELHQGQALAAGSNMPWPVANCSATCHHLPSHVGCAPASWAAAALSLFERWPVPAAHALYVLLAIVGCSSWSAGGGRSELRCANSRCQKVSAASLDRRS